MCVCETIEKVIEASLVCVRAVESRRSKNLSCLDSLPRCGQIGRHVHILPCPIKWCLITANVSMLRVNDLIL